MKRTKIVATMGPSTSSKEVLKKMFESGVNVCRLNFSHGSHEDHENMIRMIRDLNTETGMSVAILGDLQGPKIRTGQMTDNGILLEEGKEVKITTENVLGTSERFSINYQDLPKDVKAGERLLLDDGKLTLEVVKSNKKNEITAKVILGGTLSSRKGVNFPNTEISMPSLTEKDRIDLDFALLHEVDWIALSFVRHANDIRELKEIIQEQGKHTKVIAKIEKPEALDEIDEIIAESGALMVARGDLGVEIPFQNVPLIQKMLISKCRANAKPVIVATQMMESMINNTTPSRAEVNDVANAVFDGTDAVMLSGETSVGKYPVEVINAMSNIVGEIEAYDELYNKHEAPEKDHTRFITDSICFNAVRLCKRVDAKAILTMSFTGYTGYKVASQRPNANIFVFTSNRRILTQLNLIWGVKGYYYNKTESTDKTIADIKNMLKDAGKINAGDLVINIASMPIEEHGNSNMLKLSYVD
ncbi:MAG: pyruvate kinase [Fluviicola sp. XM-24bin1]|nr:MAG: pyruvate kinase [Fluviicola sp. XM-24bin1]